MRKQKKFCTYCGGPVTRVFREGRHRDYCARCDTVFYENPLPVASSIVINEAREVLLVKRGHRPYAGMWCLPIGFAEMGEAMREAALRELREETGIEGEILRLVDVDTVENPFYGTLAIVTYEVRMTGGNLQPGDDAVEARFYPFSELPDLAWSSNTKALDLLQEHYRDAWAMIDSFKGLYPAGEGPGDIPTTTSEHRDFLSTLLVTIIEQDLDEIALRWEREVRQGLALDEASLGLMREVSRQTWEALKGWLRREAPPFAPGVFRDAGKRLGAVRLPLPDVLNAMALSRKAIWTHVVSRRVLSTPLEIYTTLELNNRIILYYDKVNALLVSGYVASGMLQGI